MPATHTTALASEKGTVLRSYRCYTIHDSWIPHGSCSMCRAHVLSTRSRQVLCLSTGAPYISALAGFLSHGDPNLLSFGDPDLWGFQVLPLWCTQEPKAGQAWGTLAGAARLGERASIGYGAWTTAHGGAIESLLDEATAELVKMEWAPMMGTIEARRKTLNP